MTIRNLILALLFGVLVVACQSNEEPAAPQTPAGSRGDTAGSTAGGDTLTTTVAVLDPSVVELAIREPIVTTLNDSAISLSGTPELGANAFQITNNGTSAHSFAVEGQGVREALEGEMQPLEVRTLNVELTAGTFRAFCPVAGHAARGETREFTIAPATGQ
ncbi:MAG TPA: hypothetical protein VM557_02750 [Thermoanaerobaculia bacterium]|nr:hypothetical protein [Thermoanaerobaculia bacterium]